MSPLIVAADALSEAILRWPVRVAVACWLLKVVLERRRFRSGSPPSVGEAAVWAAGCVAYLVHVWAAFEFRHEWSHTEAAAFTAEESRRVVGFPAAWGIWVNYLFTAAWIADASRVAAAAARRRRTNRRLDRTAFWFFAFIIFNSTVVFGPPAYRWLAVIVAVAWIAAATGCRRRTLP